MMLNDYISEAICGGNRVGLRVSAFNYLLRFADTVTLLWSNHQFDVGLET